MKLSEAYKILELPENSSQEEVKKKFRTLTKKYHPDINKEPDAENTFKKINQAYSRIQSGEPDEAAFSYQPNYNTEGMGFDISDLFGGFGGFGRQKNKQSRPRQEQPIHLSTDLTFKEAIYGCKKDISYSRKIPCKSCDGEGNIPDASKSCKKCNGAGQFVSRQGNTVISQVCTSCFGKKSSLPCTSCNSTGYSTSETSVSVSIPPGVINKNILKLQGMGNFAGTISDFFNTSAHAYSDVFLTLNVENNDFFKIEENDIVCHHTISLLDALKGKTDSVETLDGNVDIAINPKTKNKDEIILPNKGVGRLGNQKIILNVEYPDNVQDIINVMEQKCQ